MALFLVTGGCGFIGSHLTDQLVARGDRVRILDDLSSGHLSNVPAEAEVRIGSVTDPDTVTGAMEGVAGCFHLAAIASVARSNEDWAGTHRVNLTGAIHVLDSARAAGVPVVYASSAAVYGAATADRLDEASPTRPLTAYGADKLGCELHARVAGLIHGVPTCGLRFFNVYGPRQDPRSPYSGVISIFADRVRAGLPITIHGDGGQARDFVFVGDVVRHLLAALDHASTKAPVLNVCTGRATTVNELAQAVMEAAGRRVEVTYGTPRAGDIRRSVGNPGAAREHLGVAACVPLAEGLALTLAAQEREETKGLSAA